MIFTVLYIVGYLVALRIIARMIWINEHSGRDKPELEDWQIIGLAALFSILWPFIGIGAAVYYTLKAAPNIFLPEKRRKERFEAEKNRRADEKLQRDREQLANEHAHKS